MEFTRNHVHPIQSVRQLWLLTRSLSESRDTSTMIFPSCFSSIMKLNTWAVALGLTTYGGHDPRGPWAPDTHL